MTARMARQYLTWRRWPRCWAVFSWRAISLRYEGDMVKRMQHIGTFLHNEMGISLRGISPMCGRSSIHLQKIFFLRSIGWWHHARHQATQYHGEDQRYGSLKQNHRWYFYRRMCARVDDRGNHWRLARRTDGNRDHPRHRRGVVVCVQARRVTEGQGLLPPASLCSPQTPLAYVQR